MQDIDNAFGGDVTLKFSERGWSVCADVATGTLVCDLQRNRTVTALRCNVFCYLTDSLPRRIAEVWIVGDVLFDGRVFMDIVDDVGPSELVDQVLPLVRRVVPDVVGWASW